MYIRELPEASLEELRDDARRQAPDAVSVSLDDISFKLEDEFSPHLMIGGDTRLDLDTEALKAIAAHLEMPQRFLVQLPADEQQFLVERIARRKGGAAVVRFHEFSDRVGDNPWLVDVKDPGQEVIEVHRYIEVAREIVGERALITDYVNTSGFFRLDVAVRQDADYGVGGDSKAKLDAPGRKPQKGDLAGGGISIEQNRTRNLAPVIWTHIFRYWCTNGAVATDDTLKIDLRHVNRDDLITEMRAKGDRAFRRVERMIAEYYDMRVEKVENAHARLLAIGHETGIPDRTLMRIQDVIPAEIEGEATMFDIVNLISNMANEPSILRQPASSRRYQNIAGNLVGEHAARCRMCQQAIYN